MPWRPILGGWGPGGCSARRGRDEDANRAGTNASAENGYPGVLEGSVRLADHGRWRRNGAGSVLNHFAAHRELAVAARPVDRQRPHQWIDQTTAEPANEGNEATLENGASGVIRRTRALANSP